MKFKHAIPILYSADILQSLNYYTEILGFENKWAWGNPPSFGGVSKDSAEIFFCKNGQGNPGTWLSLFIDNIDGFYETLKTRGAKILTAPENKEWGVREMLVEDPDGHKIRFGQSVSFREKSAKALPDAIKIILRPPTISEYRNLVSAVGWSSTSNNALTETLLAAAVFAVVAVDTEKKEVVGCALLLGDQASFYYVKDLMVHPNSQGKRIGTELMKELVRWLEKNAADDALVGLFTGENLEPFYRQFEFYPAFGMNRRIQGK